MIGVNKEDIIAKPNNSLQNVAVYNKSHGTIEYDMTAARYMGI